jgi:hypothetical protein
MKTKLNTLESNGAEGSSRTVADSFAIQAPAAGDCAGVLPEFGRVPDVQRIFGIKRGILYRRIQDGTIKSITLREPGRKFGIRLIHLASVRTLLHRELEAQNPPVPALDSGATHPDALFNLTDSSNPDPEFVNNADQSAPAGDEPVGEI